MTAKIIEFKKPSGDKPHHRKTDKAPPPRMPTPTELFQDVIEEVLVEWQAAAVKNKLNEYIFSKLPAKVRPPIGTDCVNDLNVISQVEQKMGIKVGVFCPEATPQNPYGWITAFHIDGHIFSTPPDMSSEANARAMNLVLYTVFTNQVKALNMAIS